MQPAWLLLSYRSGDVMEYFNYQLSLLAPSMRSAYIIMEPELSPSDHAFFVVVVFFYNNSALRQGYINSIANTSMYQLNYKIQQ